MDKIAKYESTIIQILEEYGEHYKGCDDDVLVEKIIDSKNHHYLLILVGWDGDNHIYHCLFHFDIIGDKIWIQKNDTDYLIAEDLNEKGISNEEIVLGLKPPSIRKYTDYAEA